MAKCISYYKCTTCQDGKKYELDEMLEHLIRSHSVDTGEVNCNVNLANIVIHTDGHYTNTYRMRFDTGEVVMKTEDIYLEKDDGQ